MVDPRRVCTYSIIRSVPTRQAQAKIQTRLLYFGVGVERSRMYTCYEEFVDFHHDRYAVDILVGPESIARMRGAVKRAE